jgi:ApbE superfamily uncharacterized protein (UPF0280 family)
LHEPRTYRHPVQHDSLVSFSVTVKETDLFVLAGQPLEKVALDSVLRHRGYLERFIAQHSDFAASLVPWPYTGPMPEIVRDMIHAAENAGVGPMAAVAGAVAERVAADLLLHSEEVIIENGGDVFIKTGYPVTVGIFAGKSPLSLKIGVKVHSEDHPIAVCTSSGSVGHSLSFGRADAVSVVSSSCALADAAATAIGNRIQSRADIAQGIEFGKTICGVDGVLIILGDRIGMWGKLELIPLKGKKA